MKTIPKKDVSISINKTPKDPSSKNILLIIKNIYKDKGEEIMVKNTKLKLRKEFHITLIGNKDALKLKEKIISLYGEKNIKKILDKIKKDIKQLIKKSLILFTEDYRVLEKRYPDETRISVVEKLETSILKKFRTILQNKYGIKISETLPVPHITIYKQESNLGIGLYKRDDLEKYSIKKIKI